MKTLTSIVSALALSGLVGASAAGAISTVAGMTTQIGAPASCTPTSLTGPIAYAWDEQQGVPVANLFVDMTNNPCPNPGAAIPGLLSGVVDSHFIHFEDFSGLPPAVGSVTFNDPIVGVIFYNAQLDATDALLGAGGTVYPTLFPFRDLTTNTSFFSISGSTINFSLDTISPVLGVMQVRVLTQVPAPGSAVGVAMVGAACFRRRRS